MLLVQPLLSLDSGWRRGCLTRRNVKPPSRQNQVIAIQILARDLGVRFFMREKKEVTSVPKHYIVRPNQIQKRDTNFVLQSFS